MDKKLTFPGGEPGINNAGFGEIWELVIEKLVRNFYSWTILDIIGQNRKDVFETFYYICPCKHAY